MKNKLILLGMILSFQISTTDVFGQLSRTVTYGYSATLSGGYFNYPSSLIPIPAGGYLYFPRHKNLPGGTLLKPEIAFLDNDLNYVTGSPLTFTIPIGRGAVIHEAKCIDPITYPNIYAIVGSLTSAANSEFENEGFAFLYDIVNGTSSNLIGLGVNMAGYTGLPNQMTAGLGFINVTDANVTDGKARCLIVQTNPYQVGKDNNLYTSSTLNLLYIDPLGMNLTLQHIYDIHPSNGSTKYKGVDMEVDGNSVITLATYSPFSELSRFPIGYNSLTVDFSIQSPTSIVRRRVYNGASGNSNPNLSLNKIQIIGGRIVLTGNVGDANLENGIILDFQLANFFSTSIPPVINNSTRYWDANATRTISRSANIDPTNNNRIAVYSTTNGINNAFYTPQISFYNLTSHTIENLENSTTHNSIAFLWPGQNNGGVGKYWSPICCNNNQILIATIGGLTNSTNGLRNSLYAYNGNGIESPDQTNQCVAPINYSFQNHAVNILQYTLACVENTLPNLIQPMSFTALSLNTTQSCYNPPTCIDLLPQIIDCHNIQLSVPGFTNVSWNDNGNLSTGASITISDIDCHHIVYSYDEIVCEYDFQACLTPSVCQSVPSRAPKQSEMTRWTLDNTVTEFASAQKQMKDGNKHTLCYEKYNNKSGQFEQITCEEVQSTEDITKVEFDFTAYPSPASESITIEVSNFAAEDNYKAILFTTSGSNVKEFRLKSKTAQYSLDGVNSGSYLLTMYQGNKKVSSKTIIVRK